MPQIRFRDTPSPFPTPRSRRPEFHFPKVGNPRSNVTHTMHICWVAQNSSPVFSPFVDQSSPLSTHAQEILQFTIFCLMIYCFIPKKSAIKLQTFPKFAQNADLFKRWAQNLWPNFIHSGHQTCVKIWWWSTERPQRLGTGKRKKEINDIMQLDSWVVNYSGIALAMAVVQLLYR